MANSPEKVRESCPTLRYITDATEIYIGISGDGAINFVSTLEGRSISDRDLTVKSGILSKDWAKVDVPVADDLASMGVKLNIPTFLKGKGQFEDELAETRCMAKFCIHVE